MVTAEADGEEGVGLKAVGAEKPVGAEKLVGAESSVGAEPEGLALLVGPTVEGTTVSVEGDRVNNFRAQARSGCRTILGHPRGD